MNDKFMTKRLVMATAAAVSLLCVCGVRGYSQDKTSETSDAPDYSSCILTPKAPDTPRINGPKIFGVRPGSDFLFRIPATGVRPMTFSAENLPKGLKLDPQTGIITGKVKKEGTYNVTLKAANSLGENSRGFRIVVGDMIALTPPMGWNSWNCWGSTVNHEKVMTSAKALLNSGLADYGWSYVNIDDGWQGLRGGEYNAIQTNSKFPDMKALVDSLHAMGFKAGIYSGPWVITYAGHIGSSCPNADGTYSWVKEGLVNDNFRYHDPADKNGRKKYKWLFGKYSFVEQDTRQWVEWGFDYLKYDWGPQDWYSIKEMHDALRSYKHDVVFSLSNSARLPLAAEYVKYANCWRTTGDIKDTWQSVSTIGFGRNTGWAPYSGPGHWPDADMLVIGNVGWSTGKPRNTRLTPDEQYSHITLWAMQASPLLIGCDLATVDEFTISLLSNNEVIDINQDVLGYAAGRIEGDDSHAIYAKPLEDGTLAVALFNISDTPQNLGFVPKSMGIIGTCTVRDVWRQKDIAKVGNTVRWETEVAPHGVVLLRLSPGLSKERGAGGGKII